MINPSARFASGSGPPALTVTLIFFRVARLFGAPRAVLAILTLLFSNLRPIIVTAPRRRRCCVAARGWPQRRRGGCNEQRGAELHGFCLAATYLARFLTRSVRSCSSTTAVNAALMQSAKSTPRCAAMQAPVEARQCSSTHPASSLIRTRFGVHRRCLKLAMKGNQNGFCWPTPDNLSLQAAVASHNWP